MGKQIVVIGLGRFGLSLAESLTKNGHDVLAIDASDRKVQSVEANITHAVNADATDESVLSELGVKNFDIGVVAIGSDIQSSVLSTLLLKRLGVPYIVARANNSAHGEILSKIGVDKVVFPEFEMGDRVSHEMMIGNISSYFPVAPGYGITNTEAKATFIGKTLAELGIGPKGKEYVSVLLIRRKNEIIITPSQSETIKTGDILTISGSDDKIEAFLARIGVQNVAK